MKRFFSALAVMLAAAPAIAAPPSAPPAPPSATHTGTVGLYLGNVWFANADPMISLADVQTLQRGNGYNGNWLAASFVANQISFDSRFSNIQTSDGRNHSFEMPGWLQSSYGGPPNTNMIVVSPNDTAYNNIITPPNDCSAGGHSSIPFGGLANRIGYPDEYQCVLWVEAKGTISLGPYDTLFIAHDGGVMLRASQADPVTDTGAWVAPFRAVVAGGVVCEKAAFGRSAGSYNIDLLYQQTGDSTQGNIRTPAVLALMVVPQGSPIPTCQ